MENLRGACLCHPYTLKPHGCQFCNGQAARYQGRAKKKGHRKTAAEFDGSKKADVHDVAAEAAGVGHTKIDRAKRDRGVMVEQAEIASIREIAGRIGSVPSISQPEDQGTNS